MFQTLFQWWNRYVGYRVPILIVLILALFNFDLTTLSIVGFALAFLACQALASHFLRKVLFPYLDLSVLFEKVKENAIACAITILAVCIVLSTLLNNASALWLRQMASASGV